MPPTDVINQYQSARATLLSALTKDEKKREQEVEKLQAQLKKVADLDASIRATRTLLNMPVEGEAYMTGTKSISTEIAQTPAAKVAAPDPVKKAHASKVKTPTKAAAPKAVKASAPVVVAAAPAPAPAPVKVDKRTKAYKEAQRAAKAASAAPKPAKAAPVKAAKASAPVPAGPAPAKVDKRTKAYKEAQKASQTVSAPVKAAKAPKAAKAAPATTADAIVAASPMKKPRSKMQKQRASEGRRAVLSGERPTLRDAMRQIMGTETMNAAMIYEGLKEKGWLPNAGNPKEYIGYSLSAMKKDFERVPDKGRGYYKVKGSVPAVSVISPAPAAAPVHVAPKTKSNGATHTDPTLQAAAELLGLSPN